MKNESPAREHLLKQILAQQKKINGLEKIIAAQSQTEDTLKTSEANLSAILENNADGILIVDMEGTVLYVNPAAQKLFGKSKKDFIGYSFGFPVSLDKEENLLVIRKGDMFREAELRVVRVQWKKQPAFQLSVRDITERMKAENEIKLKNVILSAQMETSIDGILVVDENSRIISFNMRFISLWDIPSDVMETKSDEIVLNSIVDKVAAPDQFIKKVSYLYKHREEISFDEILLSDGRVVERYSAPMTGQSEKYYGRIWFFRDITERKRSEERINFQARLLGMVGQAIVATDSAGIITYWNKAAFELYGWAQDEAIGRNVIDTIVSHSTKTQASQIMEALASGKSWAGEFLVQNKDGTIFPAHVSDSPILDDAGNLIGIIGVSYDITERKRSEEALRKSEEKFRSIMENSADAIFITDQTGKYMYTNKAVTRMLGFTSDEMKSKSVIDLAPKNKINEYMDFFEDVLAKGRSMVELELLKNDGSYISTDLNSVILPDGMVYGSCRDITERVKAGIELAQYRDHLEELVKERTEELKKAKEQAEEASKAKSRFVANMSHEIRTPLNAILGFSQLMIRDPLISEKQKERLVAINRSGENLLSLINDILEISKIEAGKITINNSVFDFYMLLEDLEVIFRIKTDAQKLTFIMEKSENTPRFINTDETKLRQILINLIGNAIKFTTIGGISVRVKVRRGTEQIAKALLMVEVEDSGIGISENDIKKLFRIFEQTDSGSKMGGTGLGLALSKHFAKALGGDIAISSKVNRGSIFCLSINIMVVENADFTIKAGKKYVIGLKPGQKPYNLLVVDDKVENRLFLSELLRELGFLVIEAEDGRESIIKFREFNPDLILMDLNMPDMKGSEAIMHIRNLENGNIVPIIAVSASVFEEDKVKILKTGVNAFIRKPFRDYEIFDIIQSTLGVEYIYKEDEPEGKYTISEIKEFLSKLPEDLLNQISETAIKAEIRNLLNLIDKAAIIIPEIAPYLRQLAKEYKYDFLINLLPNRRNNNE